MNRKRIAIIGLALCASAMLALTTTPAAASPQELYHAGELNVDLFGTYSANQHGIDEVLQTDLRGGAFGAGIGVQYYLTRNFGAQLDAVIPNADDSGGRLFEATSISALARIPLGAISPYATAGVDHNFSDQADQWGVHAGLGLEWRFTSRFGTFGETRYLWETGGREDVIQFRTGVRLSF